MLSTSGISSGWQIQIISAFLVQSSFKQWRWNYNERIHRIPAEDLFKCHEKMLMYQVNFWSECAKILKLHNIEEQNQTVNYCACPFGILFFVFLSNSQKTALFWIRIVCQKFTFGTSLRVLQIIQCSHRVINETVWKMPPLFTCIPTCDVDRVWSINWLFYGQLMYT